MPIERLPLGATGKLDRGALPEPEWPTGTIGDGEHAPRTGAEKTLATIWSEVLRVPAVGVRDNYFTLGGDSILGIQIVSAARRAGLNLTPRHLFKHQTVAELAAAAEDLPATAVRAEQGPVVGETPLTPVQHYLFDTLTGDPAHLTQAVSHQLASDTDETLLRGALTAVLEHHDALRLRFEKDGEGRWHQHVTAPEGPAHLEVLDLPPRSPAGTDAALRELAERLSGGFDLSVAPLFRAALCRPAGDQRPVLILAAHHLAVDAVSWHILLEDLDTAYRALRDGHRVDLGVKTTSFRAWAHRLLDHTAGGGFDDELAHWQSASQDGALPTDLAGANTAAHEETVTVRLDREDTRRLLQDVPDAYRTRVNDVLLCALGRVVARWTGRDRVAVTLEGHGRAELFDGVDLSRTVGWFTSVYPVVLDVPRHADTGAALKSAKESLRAVPGDGLGYGALRHLRATAGDRLPDLPQLGFNYLGQQDGNAPTGGLLHAPHGGLVGGMDRAAERPHLIDVLGRVTDKRLEFTWAYSREVYRRDTVDRLAAELADELRAIVRHCAGPGAGGRTPSDFPLAPLDQEAVDRLVGTGRDIVDVYPLTPTQSGMVVHGMDEPAGGVYTEQVTFVMDGVRDTGVLAAAWQHVVDRTPVLRTAVVLSGVPVPLQAVHRTAVLPVTEHDWSALTPERRTAELERLLADDKARGITLDTAPLLRVTLIRTAPDEVRVVWTFHHVLLDGWSVFHVLSDVVACHAALAAGDEPRLPDRRPFADYAAWFAGRDTVRAEEHWRTALAGLTAPTALPYDRRPAPGASASSGTWLSQRLGEDSTRRLQEFARRHRLTLNTVVEGAWGLLLSRWSGESEVCYGTTVSGRPSDLPGADTITGLFITTLPARATVDGGDTCDAWLRRTQAARADDRRFGHVPLTRLHTFSDLPAGTSLFDSLLVFENYPVDDSTAGAHGVQMRDLEAREATNYPITVVISPGERLSVELGYDPRYFEESTARSLADQLLHTLHVLAEATGTTRLDAVDVLPPAERSRLLAGPARPGGDLVALTLPRSAETILAQLAVTKAGAAFLPVDPGYPQDRIALMLRDAAPSVTLGSEEVSGLITGVPVDEPGHRPTDADRVRPLRLDDPAYVIYTSGGRRGRPRPRLRHAQLRRLRARTVHVAAAGGEFGGAPARPAARCRAGGGAAWRACHAHAVATGRAGHAAAGHARHAARPQDPDRRSRCLRGGVGRAVGAVPPSGQFVRAHRSHRRRHLVGPAGAGRYGPAHRQEAAAHRHLRTGRTAASRARRSGR